MFLGHGTLPVAYQLLPVYVPSANPIVGRPRPYAGVIALLVSAVAVTKPAQLCLYLYLFRVNMSIGVPRLLVNLFTLIFATTFFGRIASEILVIKLAPLLATSAAFSIILGLAMQETLGNLFSGVALQLARPFILGDWVEVQNDPQKWVGQVHEITWRAMLLDAVKVLPGILEAPAPIVLIIETTESWILFKVFYSIQDVGIQYRLADKIFSRVLEAARVAGVPLARQELHVTRLSK